MSLTQTRELHGRRAALMEQFLKVWHQEKGQRIDALICPVAPHPVPPIDAWNGVSYTSSFVLLDCPAGFIPVRRFENSDMEGDIPKSEPISSWDKRNRDIWTSSDRHDFIGSSLGIQVPRLQERRLCQAMAIIDEAIKDQRSKQKNAAKL